MKINMFTLLLCIVSAFAQNPGELDNTFSDDGFDRFQFVAGGYINFSQGITVDDTRIYVTGSAGDGTYNRIACLAYTLNGVPDPSFANNGKFQSPENVNGGG